MCTSGQNIFFGENHLVELTWSGAQTHKNGHLECFIFTFSSIKYSILFKYILIHCYMGLPTWLPPWLAVSHVQNGMHVTNGYHEMVYPLEIQ